MEARKLIRERFILEGLNCANCAAKIEKRVSKLDEVKKSRMNFAIKTLDVEVDGDIEEIADKIAKVADEVEPGVKVRIKGRDSESQRELILEGLGCADCAAKMEREIGLLDGVDQASINFVSQKLKIKVHHSSYLDSTLKAVKRIVKEIEPDVIIREEKDESGHHNSHSHGDNSDFKAEFLRLGIGAVFFIAALLLKLNFWGELALYGIAYLTIGGKVLTKSAKNISKGQIFDENFLMSVASIGAFAIKEFPEGVAVMLFYEVGELFQDIAVNRSRSSIKSLMDIRPDYANLKVAGELKKVDPNQVKVDDIIVVKPGEKVPLDGEVIGGESMVDTSALTGESVPRKVRAGKEILSGFINKDGLLTIRVTSDFAQSTVNKILDLVENAASEKAPTENFITKFARYYTPAVVFSALALAVLPPLVIPTATFSDWLYRALVFLVVSCPCALVVSIPLGFFGGIGAASKHGVLVKGGNYLEALNSVKTVVMDKTGTLTEGTFRVTDIVPAEDFSKEELLELAAYAESNSNHPIAVSILDAYEGKVDSTQLDNYQEIAGHGLKVTIADKEVLAGNYKLMKREGVTYLTPKQVGTVVHIAVAGQYAGYILIADRVKTDAKAAIRGLKSLGIEEVVMLTGDGQQVAESVATELGVDDYRAELLPQDKVAELEKLLKNRGKDKLLFVGDGINDAPVLARADIGVAMGGLGSDAAIEAADVVLMKDKPSNLIDAINVAKFTRRVVWQNIVFALGIKGIVLLMGALGLANMWFAVFADVGVALLAVLNAMRITRMKSQ
ncbi:Cd2+/Zn2+-exporting ATPase [Orenia metallireducens]|uniref:Cd2+/Zn2+-exporting ATPase n=1 Tax=Orenia metallireducens TaxID=1413210 RepID=A0A285HCN4_9FIRM|nr:heavy metal translocating P-type ATPase [Orenia metallireducens]PRX27699.1 Cd2+/Zn2+-exporting ATPase [Orenia metallireducens]SNY33490.1 Cd2+/Zn2+-exporting ATPase [Orenia metallireducens]